MKKHCIKIIGSFSSTVLFRNWVKELWVYKVRYLFEFCFKDSVEVIFNIQLYIANKMYF